MTISFALSAQQNTALLAASAVSISSFVAGHEMVELPGGPFVMGFVHNKRDSSFPRWVELSPFAIGRTAVSAKQYRSSARGYSDQIGRLQADHPVTDVSWFDAVDYVARLGQQSKRPIGLPTEAQWEYAARGPALHYRDMMAMMEAEGLPRTLEAFIEGFAPNRVENVVRGAAGQLVVGAAILNDLESSEFAQLFKRGDYFMWRVCGTPSGRVNMEEVYYHGGVAPVDWGPDHVYGLRGMMGGVSEWVDGWSVGFWDMANPKVDGDGVHRGRECLWRDPRGPQVGTYKVLCGAPFSYGNLLGDLLASNRLSHSPGFRSSVIGFRVAASQDPIKVK